MKMVGRLGGQGVSVVTEYLSIVIYEQNIPVAVIARGIKFCMAVERDVPSNNSDQPIV